MDTIPGLFFLVPLAIWLGALAFVIVMTLRLVKGVERIADALERK